MKKLVIGLMVAGVFLFGTNAFALVGIDANTVLMLHSNGDDGSTNFVDDSFSSHSVAAHGNAQIDTAQSKFGGAGGLFDGTGDYLSLADSDDWYFSDQPFTIDTWVRFNSTSGQQDLWAMAGTVLHADDSVDLYYDAVNHGGTLYFYIYQNGNPQLIFYTSNTVLSTNTWYHIALVRIDNANADTSWRIFVDGVSQTLTYDRGSWNASMFDSSNPLYIGGRSTGYYLNGWMDEFRISKGIARWTSDLTPPTSEYGVAPEAPIPEPSSLFLFGIGGLATLLSKRKRKLS